MHLMVIIHLSMVSLISGLIGIQQLKHPDADTSMGIAFRDIGSVFIAVLQMFAGLI
jgi:hypothetical protein